MKHVYWVSYSYYDGHADFVRFNNSLLELDEALTPDTLLKHEKSLQQRYGVTLRVLTFSKFE